MARHRAEGQDRRRRQRQVPVLRQGRHVVRLPDPRRQGLQRRARLRVPRRPLRLVPRAAVPVLAQDRCRPLRLPLRSVEKEAQPDAEEKRRCGDAQRQVRFLRRHLDVERREG